MLMATAMIMDDGWWEIKFDLTKQSIEESMSSKLAIKYIQRKRCEPGVTTPLTDTMLHYRLKASVASSSSKQKVSLISTLGLKCMLISTLGFNSICKKMTSPRKYRIGLNSKSIWTSKPSVFFSYKKRMTPSDFKIQFLLYID